MLQDFVCDELSSRWSVSLGPSDVFLTPYRDAEQIVSGALSFAVAAGLPFVSTPYRYATELAVAGCGVTVDFGDDAGMARALAAILVDDERRRAMSTRASSVAASRSWPEVGLLISDLCRDVTASRRGRAPLRGGIDRAGAVVAEVCR